MTGDRTISVFPAQATQGLTGGVEQRGDTLGELLLMFAEFPKEFRHFGQFATGATSILSVGHRRKLMGRKSKHVHGKPRNQRGVDYFLIIAYL